MSKSQLSKPSKKLGKRIGKLPISKQTLVVGLVLAFTLRIFRSGLQDKLTLWGWIFNHTIYGPPLEYIPKEDYMNAFREEES